MTPESERKLKSCVTMIYAMQKGTACERSGVETSEKDGTVIIRYPVELETGDIARCTLLLGARFAQNFCELKSELAPEYRLRATMVVNAVNQATRFGHMAVDSRDGRVYHTFAQLTGEGDDLLTGGLAVALTELGDFFSPVLDFLDSPMERQDLDDCIEALTMITHAQEQTLPYDEIYPEEDE